MLAALRRDGRQIICALKDEALADLLCRRLLSTVDQPGRRLTIDAGPKGAATVVDTLEIPPMAENVLRGPVQAAIGKGASATKQVLLTWNLRIFARLKTNS